MYSERFNLFFDRLTSPDIEGGRTTDTGGLTNYGISQNAYPNEDIDNMTLERAKEIYWQDFYTPLRCDEISDVYFAFQFFVAAVNIGVGDAKKHIWQVLGLPLTSTIVGKITLAELDKKLEADRDKIFSEFLESLVAHYFQLAEKNPEKYGKYLHGWINRLVRALNL